MTLDQRYCWVDVWAFERIFGQADAMWKKASPEIDIRPSIASKCTTVAQLSTVFIALLNPKLPDFYMIQWSLCWLTAGLTIISGLHYIYIGLNILQDASENNQTQK